MGQSSGGTTFGGEAKGEEIEVLITPDGERGFGCLGTYVVTEGMVLGVGKTPFVAEKAAAAAKDGVQP